MIELKSIYKSFEDKDVLMDINARFENGKTNLIIGQSGSGKTVLMKNDDLMYHIFNRIIMRHQKHCRSVLFIDFFQKNQNVSGGFGIQCTGRLIQKKELWIFN